ncbi:MAG: LytS/YehU family sensor histidine kinase, partial [Cyclobacteriaceae bacterium]
QIEGKAKLYVSVAMDNMKNMIDIEVINDLPGNGPGISDSTGIGLSNLKERLDAFYHCHIKFSAGESKDNMFRVAYSIPFNP